MYSYRLSRFVVLGVIIAMVVALIPTFSQAEAAGDMIAYGDVVQGQINNKNYFELWQFEGQKGDRVKITMVGDEGLDPYLGLIDAATEEVLAEDDDSAGGSNALIETTLPSGGTFVIVATRYNFDQGTSTGPYALELLGGSGPQNTSDSSTTSPGSPEEISPGVFYMGELALAEPVAGTIANDSYAQLYSVELQKGDDFLLAMFANESNLDTYLIFGTEDGDVLAEDDDSGAEVDGLKTDSFLRLTIPADGVYIIVATRSGIDAGKTAGDYVLVGGIPEEDAPSPEPEESGLPDGVTYEGAMDIDSSRAGALTNDVFVHLYTFDGQAGDLITITMTGEGGLDSYLGLIDPNDEVIAEDDDSAGGLDSQISIRLPESGVYIIVATRAGMDEGRSTGSYTLELIAGAPEADSSSSTVGFTGLPGRAFEVEGETFFLSGSGRSDNPSKASPMESFFNQDEEALPGRSFYTESNGDFTLRGTGATDDPAKASDLESYLASFLGG